MKHVVGAAVRVHGGGLQAEPVDDHEQDAEDGIVAHCATRGPTRLATAASLSLSVTMTSVAFVAGVGGASAATRRRFQTLQPLPSGRLAGMVHLPASTNGGAASAPPPERRPRDTDGLRLGRRQPRPQGRLAVALHLPSHRSPANESVTSRVVASPGLVTSAWVHVTALASLHGGMRSSHRRLFTQAFPRQVAEGTQG